MLAEKGMSMTERTDCAEKHRVWAAWIIGIVCILVLALTGAAAAQSAGKASQADVLALETRRLSEYPQFPACSLGRR